MFVHLLYSYITNPLKAISKWQDKKPFLAGLTIIFLVSLSNMVKAHNALAILVQAVFLFLFSCIFLFIFSSVLDFTAQLSELKSQSLTLFLWLGISWIPFLLAPAFQLIFDYVPGIITLVLIVISCGLQVITLKVLYQISTKKSILLFFTPLLLAIGFFLLIMIIGIISISLFV
ncbi:hypothetical protein ACFLZV_01340 [Candidatus Margulisiibacteriota bacterium]